MKQDISTTHNIVQAIAPAVINADNTPAAIDVRNYDSAIIAIHVGVGGITFDTTNKVEFKLTHSDDNSTYTAVADEDIKGVTGTTLGIIKSLIAAHATPTVYKIGYHGGKSYLKLLADFSGTHGVGTALSALAILGNPRVGPV